MQEEKIKYVKNTKCCCLICKKEYHTHMFPKHIKTHIKNDNLFKNKKVFIDYAICGLCGMKMLEINNFHLGTHNLTAKEYDKQYPLYPRIPIKLLENKNHFKNGVTSEISKKLKFGHSLEGYIKKYGEIEGEKKYKEKCSNYARAKTLKGYIEKYGEIEGAIKYKNRCINISKAGTLEGYTKRLGLIEGTHAYNKKVEGNRKSRTLEGYIERYGEIKGFQKWVDRNDHQSRKISRYDKLEYEDRRKEYFFLVERISRISFNKFKDLIDPDNKRSLYFHLDHKISIIYGFMNKIHPIYIGSLYNLEVINRKINCSKQDKCSISYKHLKNLVEIDSFYTQLLKIHPFEF